MSTVKEKYMSEAKLSETPIKKLSLKIADKAIKTNHIDDGAVTLDKLSGNVIRVLREDLQNQIDALEIAGVAVSNNFGSNPHIGISQKTLTDAINKIWQKLEDITGETYNGFTMVVTPTYFVGEDGCTLHITANTTGDAIPFEKLSIYLNGRLLTETEDVDYFEYDTEITGTTLIKCVGKIMGVEYERQQLITHYDSFWLGAGQSYEDIMDEEHLIPVTEGMRGAHDVAVAGGDHIIIVMGEYLADDFARADMNGVEIPFTESSIIVDDKTYKVFTSVNVYNTGTFNIDINS